MRISSVAHLSPPQMFPFWISLASPKTQRAECGRKSHLHDTREARAKTMNSSIGFVVISHLDLQRLERLIGALNRTYDEPPIAIHHDFFQSNIDVSRLSGNIVFVRPHLRTHWADASIVHADLSGASRPLSQLRPRLVHIAQRGRLSDNAGPTGLEGITRGNV